MTVTLNVSIKYSSPCDKTKNMKANNIHDMYENKIHYIGLEIYWIYINNKMSNHLFFFLFFFLVSIKAQIKSSSSSFNWSPIVIGLSWSVASLVLNTSRHDELLVFQRGGWGCAWASTATTTKKFKRYWYSLFLGKFN